MYKIYTDGSYKSSTDQGGYAVVITKNDEVIKILNFGYIHTTNNRMELMGVLHALKYFDTLEMMEIYSDSSYVINSLNGHFVGTWLSSEDSDKKNLDLWKQINTLKDRHLVKFKWVKGHNNNKFNELADLYANISASVINPETDEKV